MNKPADVTAAKRYLGALGYLPEHPFERPYGSLDSDTVAATQAFQRDYGLKQDGALLPGGETEVALRDAATDTARTAADRWAATLGNAPAMSAAPNLPPDRGRTGTLPGDASITPAAWHGSPLPERNSSRGEPLPPDHPDGRVEPAQDTLSDWIIYPLLFSLLAAEANRERIKQQRKAAPGEETDDRKTEFIPPPRDEAPYRGRDATKPPLDPKQMRPAPYPGEPPLKLPKREEIRPEALSPSDWTLITPAISSWTASDLILPTMRGNARTQGRLVRLRELGESVAEERSDIELEHVGGTIDKYGNYKKEFYAGSTQNSGLGIRTTKGSAYADLTFKDKSTKTLYHISLYRVTSGTRPRKEEGAAAIRLAVNTKGETKVIIMVPNVRGDDFVDEKAFKQFLHETLDTLHGAPHAADMSDPAARARVIRYFTHGMKP
jgi:hypothetical protein